ncbi:B12-binding domain-containing radical SAM protein [Candidatus Pyrohabitans sp.]
MGNDITLANLVLAPDNESFVPIGPLYLVSSLEEGGYNVDFRDYQLNGFKDPLTPESILAFLGDSSDVVGISCIFNMLPSVLMAVEELKKRHPEKKIILGGPGPTGVAEHILRHFPSVDVVVRGEGEKTIVELLDRLDRDMKNVRGICYRDGNRVRVNPPQERIKELDTLPAYHRIKFKEYANVGVMTSRGCPYRCSFCEVSPLWGHTNYQRSIENVMEELSLLRDKYGVESIRFCDDTFVLSRKRVLEFCSEIRKEGLDIRWACMGRVNLMDRELMGEMRRAGCRGVQYGVESGSNRVLQKINKGFTKQMAGDVILKSVEYFEHVISTFIWGFPFESMEDFYETIFFMSSLAEAGSKIKFFLLSPSPLSQLYRDYRDNLRFSEELCSELVWKGYDNFINKKKISAMIRAYPEIFPDFYYIDSGNIHKKYQLLKNSELIR